MSVAIEAPGGFVPLTALAYGAADGAAAMVDASHPLPVRAGYGPSFTTPLAGTATASSLIGTFAPELGRPIVVTLSGSWTGTVRLLRSIDGGVTRLPLTYADGSERATWTGSVNAAVAEETVAGATYYLDVALSAGTLLYRMEQ